MAIAPPLGIVAFRLLSPETAVFAADFLWFALCHHLPPMMSVLRCELADVP